MDETPDSAGSRRHLLPFTLAAIVLAAILALIVFRPGPPGPSDPVPPDPEGRSAFTLADLKRAADPVRPNPARQKKERQVCTSPGGKPAVIQQRPTSANSAALWTHVRTLCFGASTGTPIAEADSIDHPVHGVRLLLMPEKRMLDFTPADLPRNRGLVVALVENWDSTSNMKLRSWSDTLRQEEEAYIYYGKDGDSRLYAVLFKFVRDGAGAPRLVRLKEGTWREVPHTYPGTTPENKKRLMARWIPFHPPRSLGARPSRRFLQTAEAAQPAEARESDGPGWVSCLRGCCPASAMFE